VSDDAGLFSSMFEGAYTALITPFRDGTLDEPALRRIVEVQIKGGIDGLVPVGTTGESPTLDYDEHIRVIELVAEAAKGRVKVMAGTGANSTKEAILLTQRAEAVGADASLQVAPYYNKPTQEGLFQHFEAVAGMTRLPIILYSIPGRCGVEISVDTIRRLAGARPNIVGIKEAGGNPDRVTQIRAACGPKFTILSGDDGLTLPFMAVGARGVISVASNPAPKLVAQMVHAAADGDYRSALKLHDRLTPLFKALFLETNPSPCKAAMELLGFCTADVRLPMTGVTDLTRAALVKALTELKLLK
jgi:4-hydroxy-tetrahydrodipicolinate synthase